jgi:hypothetical protein
MSQPTGAESSPIERATEVKRRYQAELLSKANVVGAGIGFEYKEGQKTDRVAVVVMVRRKLPLAQLAPQDVIPEELEGVPVDVQEVGEIRAQ